MTSYNIKFPLTDDPNSNSFFSTTKVTKDAFSSDLLLLLLTQRGERYYDPNYGCNLIKFIFEPNDNITNVDIENDIRKTVSTYIPSLNIDSVKFDMNVDENGISVSDNQLNVRIKFTFTENAFSESGELEIKF